MKWFSDKWAALKPKLIKFRNNAATVFWLGVFALIALAFLSMVVLKILFHIELYTGLNVSPGSVPINFVF